MISRRNMLVLNVLQQATTGDKIEITVVLPLILNSREYVTIFV